MKGRAALALPPSYETIEPRKDAYLAPLHIRALALQSGRYWSFNDSPTTIALPDNRFAKSLKGFPAHTDSTSLYSLLDEFSSFGVPRPSGYADVFHEKFRSYPVRWSVNAALLPAMAGAWQEAIEPGIHRGVLKRYDLRSAYLWAASLGLPDTRTYRFSKTPWRTRRDGLYRVITIRGSEGAPFPFSRACECLATNTEIEMYSLQIGEVVSGITWDNTTDPKRIIEAVTAIPSWKFAARSFWGRWAQSQRVQCTAKGKTWYLPNMALNVPWAHSIISRVKMRVWEMSTNAVHVFVDSVITRDDVPTGDAVGDWRLEQVYEHGVIVKGPGQYTDVESPAFDKMAGVPKDSPLRAIPARVA